jgi:formate-dependent phosphoribosylglycinamide formyltransferase (GAR transformylase)
MPGATSPWRVNDVVAYDLMREAAARAMALLSAAARSGESGAEARRELARLRREVLAVDAYDRAAVAAVAVRVDQRIRELEGQSS